MALTPVLAPTSTRPISASRARHVRATPGIAHEHTAVDDPSTPGPASHVDPVDTADSAAADRSTTGVVPTGPLGNRSSRSPLVDDVPLLGALLNDLAQVDRLAARVIDTLAMLEDTGLVETATGVDVDRWLSIVARRTGSDIRMLHTTVTSCRRLPSLANAFHSGQVSWAQVRTIVLATHRLPRGLDDTIDDALGRVLQAAADSDPDDLLHVVRQALRSIDPTDTAARQADAEASEFLALQPRLDGTGGLLHGDLGPVAFATVDAALTPVPGPACDAASDAADGTGSGPPLDTSGHTTSGRTGGPHEARRHRAGQRRLDRLVALCDQPLDGTPAPDASGGHPRATAGDGSMRSRPQLLIRAELDALLDRASTPAGLLTGLLGGIVHVTSHTARQMIDRRGADLRTVLVDDGRVVGVGRRHRVAPGWLTDATLALHDTCTAPGCRRAARTADTDHAHPWHPIRPDVAAGRTDVDQLAPLCGRHNRAKEAEGWRVTQHPDGSRIWTHPRTGLRTRTLPTAWHPPDSRPRAGHRSPADHRPAGPSEPASSHPPPPGRASPD